MFRFRCSEISWGVESFDRRVPLHLQLDFTFSAFLIWKYLIVIRLIITIGVSVLIVSQKINWKKDAQS